MGSVEKRKIICGQEGDSGTTEGEERRGKQKRKSLDNTRNDFSDRELSGRKRNTELNGGIS